MNTVLTYAQLNIIAEVLNEKRKEHNAVTWQHDQVVKESLSGNKEILDFLSEQQDANYKRKDQLDHSLFAIQEMIDNYNSNK